MTGATETRQGRAFWLAILLLLAVSALVYGNTLRNEFIWDDYDIVVNYPLIRDIGNIPEFFLVEDHLAGEQSGYYRPLARMSYVFDYQIWKLNPLGYHLTNVVLQAAATVVFFLVCRALFSYSVALLAALLFAVHPVHVENVAWVTGRITVLSGLFILLTFYFYVRYDRAAGPGRKKFYALSLMAYALALLSKEFALMVPALLAAYHLSFDRGPYKGGLPRHLVERGRAFVPFLALIALYLLARYLVVETSKELSLTGMNPLLSLKVIYSYLKIHALPVKEPENYFLASGEPFFTTRGIIASIVLLAVAAAAVLSFRKERRLFFAIAFFFIFIIPVSGVVMRTFMMAERHAYVASAGFCLAAAIAAEAVMKRQRAAALVVFFAVLTVFSYITVQRNAQWKNELTAATRVVSEMPDSPRAYYYLGNACLREGRDVEAAAAFRKSVELDPGFMMSRQSLAQIHREQGEWEQAAREYVEILYITPGDADTHASLAFAYFNLGRIDDAIAELKEVLRIRPDDATTRKNLDNLYREKERLN